MTNTGVIQFTVPGIPAPQGSKVRTKWGMREDNPATRPWRAAVAWAAAAIRPGEPAAGPVELDVRFYFPRPKSHYGTGRNAAVVKPSAPRLHATKPDADKLLRAIGDSITGILVQDDSQIADIHAVKLYGEPRAEITLRPCLEEAA